MKATAQIMGAQLARRALEVGHGFVVSGLREDTGHNDGAQIDRIERFFGLQGEPYCAMGVIYCYMKAYAFLSGQPTEDANLRAILQNDIPRYFASSPSCGEMLEGAKARGIWKPFAVPPAVHPGDLVLFTFNGSSHPQHVGLFDHAANEHVICVEFNTSAGAGGSQADGQGCFLRERSSNVVLGSIAVSQYQ